MARLSLRLALVLCAVSLATLMASRLIDGQQGDAARGVALYNGRLYCAACHLNEAIAPLMAGVAERVRQVRLAASGNKGETAALYLAESIVDPTRYVVPNYRADLMPSYHLCPPNCQTAALSIQDLKDLVAYLMTA